MAFLLKAMGFGDAIPNFPFVLNAGSPIYPCQFGGGAHGLTWSLQDGTANEPILLGHHRAGGTGSPTGSSGGGAGSGAGGYAMGLTAAEKAELQKVSIFHISLKELPEPQQEMARNAMKRVRTLRIQGLIRCLGAVEHKDCIYIATERCMPLEVYLGLAAGGGGGYTSDSKVVYARQAFHGWEPHQHYQKNSSDRPSASAQFTEEDLALGIKHLSKGLHAVHLNNMVHGAVSLDSVFVTHDGGFWRLFGFDYMSPVGPQAVVGSAGALGSQTNSAFCFVRGVAALLNASSSASASSSSLSFPPELLRVPKGDTSVIQEQLLGIVRQPTAAFALDAWGMATVIYRVGLAMKAPGLHASIGNSGAAAQLTAENARECAKQLPSALRQSFLSLAATNPAQRPRMQAFVDQCGFLAESDYVRCMDAIEMYEVLESEDKDHLMASLEKHFLSATWAAGSRLTAGDSPFPLPGSVWMMQRVVSHTHMFIPRNVAAVTLLLGEQFNPTSAQGRQDDDDEVDKNSPTASSSPHSDLYYDRHMGPLITFLFRCADKFVRLQLLHGAPLYAEKLSTSRWEEALWRPFADGFRSNSPELLAATAKASVLIAKRISPNLVASELSNLLTQLQNNPDASIRANSMVCFTEIAPQIPMANRVVVLGNVFTKGIKDPVPVVRLAAALGMESFLSWMTVQQYATILLPHIMLLTIDPSPKSREVALRVIGKGVERLRQAHEEQQSNEPGGAAGGGDPAAAASAQQLWSFDYHTLQREALTTLYGNEGAAAMMGSTTNRGGKRMPSNSSPNTTTTVVGGGASTRVRPQLGQRGALTAALAAKQKPPPPPQEQHSLPGTAAHSPSMTSLSTLKTGSRAGLGGASSNVSRPLHQDGMAGVAPHRLPTGVEKDKNLTTGGSGWSDEDDDEDWGNPKLSGSAGGAAPLQQKATTAQASPPVQRLSTGAPPAASSSSMTSIRNKDHNSIPNHALNSNSGWSDDEDEAIVPPKRSITTMAENLSKASPPPQKSFSSGRSSELTSPLNQTGSSMKLGTNQPPSSFNAVDGAPTRFSSTLGRSGSEAISSGSASPLPGGPTAAVGGLKLSSAKKAKSLGARKYD